MAFNLLGEFLHPALDFKMIAATLGSDCIPSCSSSVCFFSNRHILVSPHGGFRTRSLGVAIRVSAHLHRRGEVVAVHVSIRAALTFGRPCLRPARRPPASNSGQRSCLPAAPPSGCCRFSGCSLGSQTLKKRKKGPLFGVHVMSFCFSASPPA